MDKPFRAKVPSLTALVALDAAVRHCSFTLAAAELGVTQAAVSRQIQALEADLGTLLFQRRHRAIVPTAECRHLALALNRQFGAIADSIAEFRASAAFGTITIGATVAFTQLWLVPRLVAFRKLHPNAKLRLKTTDDPINLETAQVDVLVRYGKEPFRDGITVASRRDVLFPVTSPDYGQRLERGEGATWALDCDLIRNESDDRSWYGWEEWFAAVGIEPAARNPGMTFTDYTGTLYAARAGQGVALGWEVLIQNFLNDGTLVRVGHQEMPAEGKFHIVLPHRRRDSLILNLFVDWLTAELEPS